jgi:DNA-binding transcriptional MerR regulator
LCQAAFEPYTSTANMKVSELSQRARVPVPTIKFYIREGLLPAGERTGRNQADYSEEHLERLALIRALRDDAGLGIAAIGRALAASANAENFVGAALDALEPPDRPVPDETSADFSAARAELDALIAAQGWKLDPDSPALREAVRALSIIRRSFPSSGGELAPYAQAMMQIARHELPENWRSPEAPNAALRYGVLGTVLFEPFILALRRMAHAARSHEIQRRVTGS